MTFLIGLLIRSGVPGWLAKYVLMGGLIAALVIGLGVAKCRYDHALIAKHDAKVQIANQKADRRADSVVADQRVADERRIQHDDQEMHNAIAAAPAEPLTPRQRARACAILQRQARERGHAGPASCGPAAHPGTAAP